MNSREQFGQVAAAYATSARHVLGADGVVEFASPQAHEVAIDIATGAGHTAHSLARRVRYVLATDITPEMLSQTRRLADEKGLTNIDYGFALAESLPFADASVDIVSCRVAAHHFHDVPAFCREMRRVLKPGGRAVVDDTVSPEDDEVHDWVNDVEVHRDHSHIDDLKVSTWRLLLEEAGFEVADVHVGLKPTDHELIEWTERAATSAEDIEYIRRKFESASPRAIETLGIHREGETWVWGWPSMTILATPRS